MASGRLQGKTALVTGAARGIGEAIARAFAAEGASVLVTDVRDDLGEKVAGDIGDRALYRHLDVRREAEWERAMALARERFGGLDILANNAGITGFGAGEAEGPFDPEHCPLESWRAVHATNLDGVFLGCKHAIGAMRARGSGSIINMGSRSGVVGVSGASAYASSKGAVRNHTKSVAIYCAEQGLNIRCNVIQPAAILTPMWDPLLGDGPGREERIEQVGRMAPIGRFGTVEEVAALAVHLASDESAYTTGAEFTLDGGMLAGQAAPPAPED